MAKDNLPIDTMIELICKHLPEGWRINLKMEQGAAWVELSNEPFFIHELPDTADKSLYEQLNDALCIANGWSMS